MFVSILADQLLSIPSKRNENILIIKKQEILSAEKLYIPLDYDKSNNIDINLKELDSNENEDICRIRLHDKQLKDTFKLKSLGN